MLNGRMFVNGREMVPTYFKVLFQPLPEEMTMNKKHNPTQPVHR
jgi:hypothetical protein